jgi:pimeloyl-ACP methyl ester carboxylesterase
LFKQPSGKKLAVVSVPGTQTLGLGGGTNPLDMQSNILAMSGANQAASEKAVLLAIKQAGIEQGDELILVGHSQGGMVAANLAAFPTGFIAAGLVTFGAPIAQLSKLRTPVLAIEHVNDPVPNISGKANPLKSNWVSVQRVSNKVEADAVLFSHSLKSYRNTTAEVDLSNDAGIKNIRSKIIQKLEAAKPVKSLEFVISRESR